MEILAQGNLYGYLIHYATTYSMHLEYAEGNIKPNWYILVKDRIEW